MTDLLTAAAKALKNRIEGTSWHERRLARDVLLAALRSPEFQAVSEGMVEAASRAAAADMWKKIDSNMDDDDWCGGAALNLRDTLLRQMQADWSAMIAVRIAELEAMKP